MRFIILSLLVVFLFSFSKNLERILPEYEKIENKHPLIWKTKIGNACFRTNISFNNDYLAIGSNGNQFMDYGFAEANSGVYIMDRKTGKVVRQIGNESLGDMDVNGTLIYKDRVYFGNDNEEFICTDMRGLPIWKNVSSGDIEHKPVLLTDGNRKLLVYASELGEVRAVDPDTGKKIWSYYAPNFSGWKETENRTIFKVRAFFSSTKSFFTAPTLVDLNNDLTLDLVYVGYDDVIYAIDGKRGHLLWKWENKNEVLSMFCNTVLKENKTYIICPSFCYSDSINNRLTSLLRFDTKGKLVERIPILDPSFRNDGLNSLQHNPNEVFFTGQDSLYYYEDNKLKPLLYTGEAFTQKQWDGSNYHTTRNSYGMIFGDRLFSYEKSLNCIVLLSQHDQANPSVGFLEIIDVDQQKILGKFLLPAQSEFPPVITDVNKDGKLDLLVNCMDGYLYCYSLN